MTMEEFNVPVRTRATTAQDLSTHATITYSETFEIDSSRILDNFTYNGGYINTSVWERGVRCEGLKLPKKLTRFTSNVHFLMSKS